MTTNPPGTVFSAYANGDLVFVRIVGPGVCRESGRFESLLQEVEARHPGRIVLDLSECPRLDSTFAGAFLRLADRAAGGGFQVFVAGACEAVHDLLDTLCLGDILRSVPLPDVSGLAPLAVNDRDLSREQVITLSREGHERLSALSDENAKRFVALLKVLREQLPSAPCPEKAAPAESPAGAGSGGPR